MSVPRSVRERRRGAGHCAVRSVSAPNVLKWSYGRFVNRHQRHEEPPRSTRALYSRKPRVVATQARAELVRRFIFGPWICIQHRYMSLTTVLDKGRHGTLPQSATQGCLRLNTGI